MTWSEDPATHVALAAKIWSVYSTVAAGERHRLALGLIANEGACHQSGAKFPAFVTTLAMAALYPEQFTPDAAKHDAPCPQCGKPADKSWCSWAGCPLGNDQ